MNVNQFEERHLAGDFILKGEFLQGDYAREETLTRCERYAGWTIPNIFPDDPLMEYDEMQTDYQSVGAQATTNLANKIMMALFQPSRPFFKMELTQEQKDSLLAGGSDSAEVDAALASAERAGMRALNATNARVIMHDVMQQLIVTGNSLLYAPDGEKTFVAYSLRDYMIKRDLRGKVVTIILRETKAVISLGEELQGIALASGYTEDCEVTIYTGIKRVSDTQYAVWQELEDMAYCHKRVGMYSEETLPWIPLTWTLARGKDYGTGLVELYSGDFHKLSNLAEAINDYSLIITDVKNLVNPTGMTNVREITEAPSGAYVHGRQEDLFVHTPQVGDASQFLTDQFNATERRIGAAFLLNTVVTRNAERVTAQEIRMQAQELESSLGGVYSRLATDLQLPLARRLLRELDDVFKDIEPVIVTGLESLSRNSELDNFRSFMQDLIALAEVPEQVMLRFRFGDIIATLGAGHGVDYKKFLKDEDEVERDQAVLAKQNAQMQGAEAGAVAQAQGAAPNGRNS